MPDSRKSYSLNRLRVHYNYFAASPTGHGGNVHRSAGADANGSGAKRAGQGRIKKDGSMAATNGFHAPVVFVGELLNIEICKVTLEIRHTSW